MGFLDNLFNSSKKNQEEIARLQEKFETTQNQLKQSRKESERQEGQLKQTRTQLQDAEIELGKLREGLQATQAEWKQSQTELQQTQDQSAKFQSQLQETQGELEQSQTQLQETQGELEQSQTQLQETQGELEQSQTQLQETQGELEQVQQDLQQTREELAKAQASSEEVKIESPVQIDWFEQTKRKITIDKVKNLPQAEPESLWGFALAGLKPKKEFTGGAININGWVIGKKYPSKNIIISYQDKILDTIPVNQPRPNVTKKYPEVSDAKNCGFSSPVSLLGIPDAAELLVEVVLEDGSKIGLTKVYLQSS